MRRTALAVLVVAAALAAAPAAPAQDAPPGPAPWVRDDTAVSIPMRDGRPLAADVHLPSKPGRYPAIVIQTPYDRARHRSMLGAGQGGFGDDGALLMSFAERERYAYVVVDWRGFHGSRGAGPVRVASLGQDGHDVVEWAAAQPWCDGKVGTWGPSALGVVQYQTAAERPPHLVCAVPVVAAAGNRWEDAYEAGVMREDHLASLDRLGFGTARLLREAREPGLPLWTLARRLEGSERIDVPVLVVTGWFDHGTARQIGTFASLLRDAGPRARAESRLLIGPWHHTAVDAAPQGDLTFPGAAGAAASAVRAWFARHLRGEGDGGWAAGERVRFWRCGEEGWVSAPSWPRAVGERRFTLHSDGRIDGAPAAADEAPRAFLDDPENPVPTIGGAVLPLGGIAPGPRDQARIAARTDVLRFETGALAEPLRIEGSVVVDASIRMDAPDADLCVRLCRTDAKGRTVLLTDSAARASFRGARDGRTSAFEPVEPGEPCRVRVTLPPLAATIGTGERLTLLVSGSNWPKFERNGHTGAPAFDATRAVAVKVEVLCDAAHAAVVSVPTAPEPR